MLLALQQMLVRLSHAYFIQHDGLNPQAIHLECYESCPVKPERRDSGRGRNEDTRGIEVIVLPEPGAIEWFGVEVRPEDSDVA